jgi:riboflavin synthase
VFTGLVEELGKVEAVEHDGDAARLHVACELVRDGAEAGDSISVNGCCVTATSLTEGGFATDLTPETLARTSLGGLTAGSAVNLERPLRADGRLGGHFVQGHVDGLADVLDRQRAGADEETTGVTMTVGLPQTLGAYVVEKGSITVDGVSLTVAAATAETFSVALIPHTLAVTSLGGRRVGDSVNLEADVVAKYVEAAVRASAVAATSGGTASAPGTPPPASDEHDRVR